MNISAHREFKDRIYEQFAGVGKALASLRRLEMLDLLAQGERSVEQFPDEAVRKLRKHGFRARRLETGFPDLRTRGAPDRIRNAGGLT